MNYFEFLPEHQIFIFFLHNYPKSVLRTSLEFHFCRCKNCGLIYQNPLLDKESREHLYESKELFEKNQYSLKLRKKFNVEFDIINKEEIAKIEPHLEPIYYNGIVLKGERFTKSPLKMTQKIFNYFIEKRGVFVKSRIKSI